MASVLLPTIGSWGDLFPFVGIAAELNRRGHRTQVAASPAWEELVVDSGVEFLPIGRRIGFEEIAQHPEIFRRVPFGLRSALDRFLFEQADALTRDLSDAISDADLVVAHPAHLVAHSIAEAAGTPHAIATVFPSAIRSAHTVPGGSPWGPWSGRLGRLANRNAWFAASMATAALFDRPANRHRRQLGLPPARGALFGTSTRALGTIVMASPAVVGHPPDWSDDIIVTSFIDWDRADTTPVTAATETFLASGEPPVLVTLGASTAVDSGDFFDQVASELAAVGTRTLIVTGPASSPVGQHDPTVVHVSPYEPFSLVAPRCRAAIHHAGIGTTVAAIRAGIPQLVVPRGFDQPVTARLIADLGVGASVPWRRRSRRLRPGIHRLLTDSSPSTTASTLQAQVEPDGTSLTADAIEALLPLAET